MFTIEMGGDDRRQHRLIADAALTGDDFRAIAARIGESPVHARKVGHVAAHRAMRPEPVETRWNGRESADVAQPGDWIVTNLTPDKTILRDSDGHANTYVIRAKRFSDLYERAAGANEYGMAFAAKGRVEAVELKGGFDIIAPWGERQVAPNGYLLRNGPEVYGNNAETFAATYVFEDG